MNFLDIFVGNSLPIIGSMDICIKLTKPLELRYGLVFNNENLIELCK